tara:strand:+ start:35476 stop:36606 length:1131 start_codon:yes stop_codon:yes gene_type:complete
VHHKWLSALVAGVCLASCSNAATGQAADNAPDTAAFEAALDNVFAGKVSDDTPGCVAGATRGGEFVFAQGYGLANMEYSMPITPDSVFRMGSVSKQFTAAAVALLDARGQIDLSADIHTYLPELMDYGHEVTIEQMVHHMSGMGDYDDRFEVRAGEAFRFGNEDYWTIEEFYAAVAQHPLDHEPGTQWRYSNLAYFLLSQLVERVSGQTLAEYAQAEFFTPLGMDDTLFNDDVNQIILNRASGYLAVEEGGFETFDTNLDWVGDGGVYTTLNDMRLWDNALTQNALPEGIAEVMLAPYPGAPISEDNPGATYAYGMFVGERYGTTFQMHSGGWVAFSTMHMRLPERGLSVFAMCNGTHVSGPEVAEAVLGVLVGAD